MALLALYVGVVVSMALYVGVVVSMALLALYVGVVVPICTFTIFAEKRKVAALEMVFEKVWYELGMRRYVDELEYRLASIVDQRVVRSIRENI